MPLYGNVIYGSGETYGQPASLPFSVEPFSSLAVWYNKIILNWAPSDSNYTAFRLVRNQDALPETAEDGIILYNWTSDSDIPKSSLPITYVDGTEEDLALVPGKYVYYRIWLLDDREIWVIGGETAVLLPKRFGEDSIFRKTSQEKLLELLPKQFTTSDASPNGVVDQNSELAAFLEGFSFSIDEALTDLAMLQPPFYGAFQNPATLLLQAQQLGVTPEIGTVTRQQKKTVREAMYVYQRKGTPLALSNFAESTTGYAPTIRVSPNIMLSIEDSSFYKGTGAWSVLGPGTVTSLATNNVPTTESNACDLSYVGKVVTTGPAILNNGILSPVLYGAPVSYGKEYTFSYYVRSESGAPALTPAIKWYNYRGELLSTTTGTTVDATTSWAKQTVTGFVPGYVGFVKDFVVDTNVATVTTAAAHPFTVGDEITISESVEAFNGTYVITAATSTTLSFAFVADDVEYLDIYGKIAASDWAYATSGIFATLDISIASATTLYFDMVQIAESSVTYYAEGRCTGVVLAPSKRNYIKNPSFLETGFAWTITSPTVSYPPTQIVGVYGGLTMLSLEPAAAGITGISTESDAGLETGKFYSFSVYTRAVDAPQTMVVTMTAIDADTDEVILTRSTTSTVSDKWVRPSVSFYLPTSSLNVKFEVKAEVDGATSELQFDCAQLEQSLTPTDYVDGSMPPDYGTGWSGTPHASASFAYINKESRLSRLLSEIDNYVPFGGSYRVITEFRVEKTEITY